MHGRHIPLLPLLIGCLALLSQRPALAVVAPWALPQPLPDVGVGNPLSALRVSLSGTEQSLPLHPSDPSDLQFVNDSKTLPTSDTFSFLTLSGSLVPPEAPIAEATMTGTARFGALRGAASATYHGGGFGSAQGRSVTEFLDVIQFDNNGHSSNNYAFSWAVNGGVSDFHRPPLAGGGGATAIAQTWLLPFGPLPAPNRFTIDALAYGETRYFPNQSPQVFNSGNFTPIVGASYWVYSRMEVVASCNVDLPAQFDLTGTATADFSHTAELFITPLADSPDATFKALSGYTYTPVPLPPPALPETLALMSLFGTIRRRYAPNPSIRDGATTPHFPSPSRGDRVLACSGQFTAVPN